MCVYVYDVHGKVHISQHVCGGQRAAMKQFSLCCSVGSRTQVTSLTWQAFLPTEVGLSPCVSELGKEAAVSVPESETLP